MTNPDDARRTIRLLALAGLVASVLVFSGSELLAADGSSPVAGLHGLRQQRVQAAHRRRRIIFNNDGNSIVYFLKDKEVSAEALLADRTTGLLGTHVDSIFYCPWSTSLGQFTHIGQIGEPFYAKTGVVSANRTKDFHEQGLDPLQIMVDFCKANEIEIFMSMRMNDIHDAYPQWPEFLSQFKKDHPELLFGSREEPPKFGFWSGLDYGRTEVQHRAFQLLEEVCRNYDVDGIQLDWLRHPPHFRCSANGDDCTQLERDIMTGLHRRIRDMTEQIGQQRGRPILVEVRIPASLACCEAIGLDVVDWLDQDLVDMLVPGEWELSPWEEWVTLGRQHDVPVYPDLTWSWSRRRQGPADVQDGLALRSFRARAMNIWYSGADGIHIFNLFDPSSSVWRELGDPEILVGLDKDYFPEGFVRFLLGRDIRDPLRFFTLPTLLAPELPVKLEPTQPFTVTITIGEDLSSRSAGTKPGVTLSIQAAGLKVADSVEVRLNGHAVSDGSLAEDWISYEVPAEWIRRGSNTIRVINGDPSDKTGHNAGIALKNVHVRIARSGTP